MLTIAIKQLLKLYILINLVNVVQGGTGFIFIKFASFIKLSLQSNAIMPKPQHCSSETTIFR